MSTIAQDLRTRAAIRRRATCRGADDRLANQLDAAATQISGLETLLRTALPYIDTKHFHLVGEGFMPEPCPRCALVHAIKEILQESAKGVIHPETVAHCIARHGGLDMSIGNDILAFAAAHHPDFWDGESGADVPNIRVTDPIAFAKEVARAINEEDGNDGSTRLTRFLDGAIAHAVQQGCEGVDHE